jgi:hypothetical protein
MIGAAVMTLLVFTAMPSGGAVSTYFLCIACGMFVWSIFALLFVGRRMAMNWFQCLAKPLLVSGLSIGLYGILLGVVGAWVSACFTLLVLAAGQRVFNIVDRQERAILSRYVLARMVPGR